MGDYIYKTHDLPLLLTVGHSLLFGLILLLTRQKPHMANGILALLLMAFGLNALDTLIYWNINIKMMLASWGVWPFWVLKWAPLIQGPLIYAYVRTRLMGDFLTPKTIALHLTPVFLFPFWLIAVRWQLSEAGWLAGLQDWGLWYQSSLFKGLLTVQKVSALAYGFAALYFMRSHEAQLERCFSNIERSQPTWLKRVIWGFLAVWAWNGVMGIVAVLDIPYYTNQITDIMGTLSNYLIYCFMGVLVFYSVLKLHSGAVLKSVSELQASEVHSSDLDSAQDTEGPAIEDAAQQLQALLIEKELYLNAELTLLDLAHAANLPERYTSELINHRLDSSFFVLVNQERVKKAQELLTTTRMPIAQIFEHSGFNSKATFNRIFKRFNKITPSEYRATAKGLK